MTRIRMMLLMFLLFASVTASKNKAKTSDNNNDSKSKLEKVKDAVKKVFKFENNSCGPNELYNKEYCDMHKHNVDKMLQNILKMADTNEGLHAYNVVLLKLVPNAEVGLSNDTVAKKCIADLIADLTKMHDVTKEWDNTTPEKGSQAEKEKTEQNKKVSNKLNMVNEILALLQLTAEEPSVQNYAIRQLFRRSLAYKNRYEFKMLILKMIENHKKENTSETKLTEAEQKVVEEEVKTMLKDSCYTAFYAYQYYSRTTNFLKDLNEQQKKAADVVKTAVGNVWAKFTKISFVKEKYQRFLTWYINKTNGKKIDEGDKNINSNIKCAFKKMNEQECTLKKIIDDFSKNPSALKKLLAYVQDLVKKQMGIKTEKDEETEKSFVDQLEKVKPEQLRTVLEEFIRRDANKDIKSLWNSITAGKVFARYGFTVEEVKILEQFYQELLTSQSKSFKEEAEKLKQLEDDKLLKIFKEKALEMHNKFLELKNKYEKASENKAIDSSKENDTDYKTANENNTDYDTARDGTEEKIEEKKKEIEKYFNFMLAIANSEKSNEYGLVIRQSFKELADEKKMKENDLIAEIKKLLKASNVTELNKIKTSFDEKLNAKLNPTQVQSIYNEIEKNKKATIQQN